MKKLEIKIPAEHVKLIVEDYLNKHLLKQDLRAYATMISSRIPTSTDGTPTTCIELSVNFETMQSVVNTGERRVELSL